MKSNQHNQIRTFLYLIQVQAFNRLFLFFVFFFFLFSVKEDFFKVPCGHIKAPPGHSKGPLATSKGHALLVYSGCHHGKM